MRCIYVRSTHLPEFLFGGSVFLEEETAFEMPEFIPADIWMEGGRERRSKREGEGEGEGEGEKGREIKLY